MLVALSMAWAAPRAESCAPCHAEVVAAWKTSRHRQAFNNPIFEASWTHWPNGWCLSCHAPRPEQQIDRLGHIARDGILQRIPEIPPGDSYLDGVDCWTCHGAGEQIRTATPPTAVGQAMHPLVHDPTLATPQFCGRCHEFPFQKHTPRRPFSLGTEPAQATLSEFLVSKAAANGETCQSCHLDGHRFRGAHDEDFVRQAIQIQADVNKGALSLTLSAPGVGHAVPSGDPFRRLELQLCDDRLCSEPISVAWMTKTLQRTPTTWRTTEDTRIPVDGQHHLTVPLNAAKAWQLVMRYGERRLEASLSPSSIGYVIHRDTVVHP